MAQLFEDRPIPHGARERKEAQRLSPNETITPVLPCNFPGCSNEATQLCNRCGKVYCGEHSMVEGGTRSSAIYYECALCARETHASGNRFRVVLILIAIGMIGGLIIWYLYTLLR